MTIEELVYELRAFGGNTRLQAADKLEELAAENHLRKETTKALMQNWQKSEAAIADKDKEIAALRTYLVKVQRVMSDPVNYAVAFRKARQMINEALAFNAGGTDSD